MRSASDLAISGIRDIDTRSQLLLWLSEVIGRARVVCGCSSPKLQALPVETELGENVPPSLKLRVALAWLREALQEPAHLPAAVGSILVLVRSTYAQEGGLRAADRWAEDRLRKRFPHGLA